MQGEPLTDSRPAVARGSGNASTPDVDGAETGQTPPWVLLPRPEPGSRLSAGALVVEARGPSDVAIKQIRLHLDGASLPAAMDHRSAIIWRSRTQTTWAADHHIVDAIVVDAEGRVGSYRWSFDATGA